MFSNAFRSIDASASAVEFFSASVNINKRELTKQAKIIMKDKETRQAFKIFVKL